MRYTIKEIRNLPDESDYARMDAMTEEDSRALDEADPDWDGLLDIDWANVELVIPPTKTPISIRLDGDVLAFFKSGGPGYQSRINAVLRGYMNAAAKAEKPSAAE